MSQLKTLTLLEARDLVKEIEKEFDVNVSEFAFAASAPMQPAFASAAIAIEEEQLLFNLSLIEIPIDKKIPVLKIVRSATGLGLKESKEIVDNVPKIIKEGITKEAAEALKSEFENVGAKVEIK